MQAMIERVNQAFLLGCFLTSVILAPSASTFAEEERGTHDVLERNLIVRDVTETTRFHEDPNTRLVEGIDFWITGFDDGTSQITSELLDGKNPSVIETSFSTHPTMLYEVLPFEWDLVSTIPLMNIKHELPNEPMQFGSSSTHIANIFNVRVLPSPELEFDLPEFSVLVIELKSPNQLLEFLVPMKLDYARDSYFVSDPWAFASRLELEIEDLNRNQRYSMNKPTLTLREMRGFEFSENTVENFNVLGVPVSYNIRLGSSVIRYGFQWAGQPEELPIRYPQLPFLTN